MATIGQIGVGVMGFALVGLFWGTVIGFWAWVASEPHTRAKEYAIWTAAALIAGVIGYWCLTIPGVAYVVGFIALWGYAAVLSAREPGKRVEPYDSDRR